MPKRKKTSDKGENEFKREDVDRKSSGRKYKKTGDNENGDVMIDNISLDIDVNGKSYSATITKPQGAHNAVGVIMTHGAGGDHCTPQLEYVSQYLAHRGHFVLRFTCKGLNIKHRTNVYLGILRHLYQEAAKLGVTKCVLGGRSVGSRAAVLTANEIQNDPEIKDFVSGVFCLAYPLHPPNQATNLRDTPLLQLNIPCLFISGTEDEMATKSVMTKILHNVPGGRLKWLDGVGHSHGAKKNQEDPLKREICDTLGDWLCEICSV